jgi:two-component system sensor histidine kinase QseC
MESIATKLLELARCEGGLLPVHVEPVLLSPLVREICQSLSAVAESKHVTVFLDLPDEACWPSDPALLRAILTNLLSNAVQYCTVGGSIRLRAEHDRLLVSNTTDTLSPDDLPHLFTRFWRKDPARSSSVHCGLGLALAKAYAEALGMELRAEVTVPQEITFALSVNRA